MRLHKTSGFSLVELSIVLVILGLLVGGILGGQSLIRAAELRAVTTEYGQWQTAVNTFKQKYNALPGDMRNAVRFWGAAAGGTTDGADAACSALDHTTPSTGTETCNGNGDGLVRYYSYEKYRFWQHLANAGLISGNYTGVRGPEGAAHELIGQNIPASKISGAGWGFNEATSTVNTYWEIPHLGGDNTWILGSHSLRWSVEEAAFTPTEAWSIDAKLDDSMPGTGKVIGRPRMTCANSTDAHDYATAEYRLEQSDIACALIFPNAI